MWLVHIKGLEGDVRVKDHLLCRWSFTCGEWLFLGPGNYNKSINKIQEAWMRPSAELMNQ